MGRLIASTFGLFARSLRRAWLVWIALIVVATGTDYVDFVYGASAHGPRALAISSLAVRALGLTWITAAALRRLTDIPRPWAPDIAFWKYFAVEIAILALTLGTVIAVQRGVAPLLAHVAYSRTITAAAGIATLLALFVATLRLLPWFVALVTRGSSLGLVASWRAMSGWTIPLIGALIAVFLPFFAMHVGLTFWALGASPAMKLPLTLVDGPVSSVELMLVLALTLAIYRVVAPAMA